MTALSLEELSLLAQLASPFSMICEDSDELRKLAEKGLLQLVERQAFGISPDGLRALAEALAAGELQSLMTGALDH
jgi:hypothetical protein